MMFGATGYILGYDDGRSDAENLRLKREVADRIFYGRRSVQVDQSCLDQLTNLVEKFRSDSDHNLGKAQMFRAEALEWKDDALRYKARADALQAQVSALQAKLGEHAADLGQAVGMLSETDDLCQREIHRGADALAREQAEHQKTREQNHGLTLYRYMTTWLLDAHASGKGDTPEFAEMRDMAKEIANILSHGEVFRGYQGQPEKMARLRELYASFGLT
jgi:hypothetical protein